MATLQWILCLHDTPAVVRHCKKCGCDRPFVSSGLFRVNANHHQLDVWLVYRCAHCERTWNMTIHTRVSPRALDAALYDGYLQNDAELAFRCAHDRQLLRANNATPVYDDVPMTVEGECPALDSLSETHHIALLCAVEPELRVERILRMKLGLSRSALKKLADSGRIVCEGLDVMKAKYRAGLVLTLKPRSDV